jgi:hypothetical protein
MTRKCHRNSLRRLRNAAASGRVYPGREDHGDKPRGSLRILHSAIRRGVAVYPLVFGVATILTVTGLTLLAVRRADHRIHANVQRSVQARYVALAGIEYALGYMESHPTWRQTLPNGTWFQSQPFGRGDYTLAGTDASGNLADSETEAVTLTSTGTVDGAVSRIQVTLTPRPHPALRYACFSNTTLECNTNVVIKGPMRANQQIYTDGHAILQGNEYFETVSGYWIEPPLGPTRYDSASMSYPQPSLSYYLSLATPISGSIGGTVLVSKYVLTPTRNSEAPSAVNPNGIYSLNATGHPVTIQKTRIKGTLIIHNTGNNKVTIQHQNWIEPASPSFPTLLIYTGNGDVDFNLDVSTLSESTETVDFNEDGDRTDSFPTSVRGLVWTQNSYVQIHKSSANFTGCLIGSSVKAHDNAVVDEDPSLAQALIPGFVLPDMRIVQGSWREVQP